MTAKTTPMMEQYHALKREAEGCLLFYRMGDFFELFFDDARTAAGILDIALTSRGEHGGEAGPMCGVPVHAAEGYLARLIKAGCRVAIAEQVETPEEAKKRGGTKALVRRDIVRFVTAGTLTEETLLEPRRANVLAAVCEVRETCGIASVDISTGRMELEQCAPGEVAAALARLAPSEVVVPEDWGLGGLEVLGVDGGSTDTTVQRARAGGARLISAARGRGVQMAAGAEAARGPWLLLLHADTRLDAGWAADVRFAMQDPGRAAYFRFALDDDTPAARRLEAAVAWRCRWLALPYGDQGLLIHRDLLKAVGGIRPLPLMEDVDLVRRLGPRRLHALRSRAITSAARWQREGYLRRSARNLACLSLWFLGVPPRVIARLYA
ncbi:TIGR04283 family arsenosugar biosynthesis glycosyltransferase [Leptolyngbya sp. 15MV]|nr:TIGR04283 family arsenosugar biosynthesis glycosyltransferase [Leptolyngbya sp. 15MV]